MKAEEHVVLSTSKKERVHTVKCMCGETFDSIESEALARTYQARHQDHLRRKTRKKLVVDCDIQGVPAKEINRMVQP